MSDKPRTTIDLPFSPQDVIDGTAGEKAGIAKWDRWYASLPDDLRRKLSIHDFKRLGDLFRIAFGV